jgi:hypothetical protein
MMLFWGGERRKDIQPEGKKERAQRLNPQYVRLPHERADLQKKKKKTSANAARRLD